MDCTYVGNFDQLHKSGKKRRMIGPVTENAVVTIIEKGMACQTYREKEACRLMSIGNLMKYNDIV